MRRKIIWGLPLAAAALIGAGFVTEGGKTAAAELDSGPPGYQYRAEGPVKPTPGNNPGLTATGMTSGPGQDIPAAESEELRQRVKELTRQLLGNAPHWLGEDYTLTVNTFVNLKNLYATSSLGRYLGEQMLGELQAAGVGVIDVRKGNGLLIREGFGEYGLSRDIKELSGRYPSQAMVVGTYAYADGQILLNARLLRNRDGMVLSHASIAFKLDDLTRQLLQDEAAPPRPGGEVRIEAGR